ncbi:MAG: hypothetical protein Tsb0021_06030 [Chlamydiales bacterium]
MEYSSSINQTNLNSLVYDELNSFIQNSSDKEKEKKEIDLTEKVQKLLQWTNELNFRRGEAGKHFKKHRGEFFQKNALEEENIQEYVQLARQTIYQSIFEKGYAIRLGWSERIAFFKTEDSSDYPERFVSIGHFENEGARISTFYRANGKTPSQAIKNFYLQTQKSKNPLPKDYSTAFIAYFNKGKSDGWKIFRLDQYGIGHCEEGSPIHPLKRDIDFLNL